MSRIFILCFSIFIISRNCSCINESYCGNIFKSLVRLCFSPLLVNYKYQSKSLGYQPWGRRNEIGLVCSTINLSEIRTVFVCTTGCQEVCICPYHCDRYEESKPLQYWKLSCLKVLQVLFTTQQNSDKLEKHSSIQTLVVD